MEIECKTEKEELAIFVYYIKERDMILMQPDDFDKYWYTGGVKYIAIGEQVCAIDLAKLWDSVTRTNCVWRDLKLKQDFIDCLPPSTRSTEHLSMAFIRRMPVIMTESAIEDGRYQRLDGRHRVLWAWNNGFADVPAVWITL